ncbi:MAG TPA: hypothetical protein VHD33_01945 [Legionellaceae bacterium]|nr:hypothetical protein [Legionellaceae bacterium]
MTKPIYAAPKCYLAKIDQHIADFIKKKPFFELKFYNKLEPGDRLFLVEYCGARTGRAALCVVLENGESVKLEKRVGWSREKYDEDLSIFGLTVTDSFDKILTKDNLCQDIS